MDQTTTFEKIFAELLPAYEGHKRAHTFGRAAYIHPQRFSQGIYLPSNIGSQLAPALLQNEPLRDLNNNPYSSNQTAILSEIFRHLIDGQFFSGGRDYSLRFITGDIGEIRQQQIDGLERKVLVIPQGLRRAKVTAESFTQARMNAHPLTNQPDQILQIMAKTMALSGFEESIYYRLTAGGDSTTHGANATSIINTLVVASTWQFTQQTPYKLPATAAKMLYLAPQPSHESHFAQLKGSGRYLDRILRLLEVLDNPDMTQKGINDIAYSTPNGTLVDTTYTNLALAIRHPKKKDWTLIAFPQNSKDNYFFQGKTQATVYELLQKLGPQYQIEPITFTSPKHLAHQINYLTPLNGKKLMKRILFNYVEAMIAPGTFLGPQLIKGIVSSNLKTTKLFDQTSTQAQATRTILQLYNDAVWGLNGGLPFLDRCISTDPMYCTMFDLEELHNGNITPLKYHSLK